MQNVIRRSQNCWVGIRYVLTASNSNKGVERAEGAEEEVMLPSGTWWRTREPVDIVSGYGSGVEIWAYLFHGESV